jgi:hypothetical protein
MYWFVTVCTAEEADAPSLFDRIARQCAASGWPLLDYCIKDGTIRFLVQVPWKPRTFPWDGYRSTMRPVLGASSLLRSYAILSEGLPGYGKRYRLCGTWEAFHACRSRCQLGKIEGLPGLPSFSEIWEAKRRNARREYGNLTPVSTCPSRSAP